MTQNIIAAVIILAALLYVGDVLRRKIKAFRPKNDSCGVDCGCSAEKK